MRLAAKLAFWFGERIGRRGHPPAPTQDDLPGPRELPAGWEPLDDRETAGRLEAELRREIGSARHPLHRILVQAVARSTFSDDALYRLADGRFACVHLTWSRRPERDPRWPGGRFHASLADFRSAWSGENDD